MLLTQPGHCTGHMHLQHGIFLTGLVRHQPKSKLTHDVVQGRVELPRTLGAGALVLRLFGGTANHFHIADLQGASDDLNDHHAMAVTRWGRQHRRNQHKVQRTCMCCKLVRETLVAQRAAQGVGRRSTFCESIRLCLLPLGQPQRRNRLVQQPLRGRNILRGIKLTPGRNIPRGA